MGTRSETPGPGGGPGAPETPMPPSFSPGNEQGTPPGAGAPDRGESGGGWRRMGRFLLGGSGSPRTLVAVLVVTMASGGLFWLSAASARDSSAAVDLNLVGLVRTQERIVTELDTQNRTLRDEAQSISQAAAPTPSASPTSVTQLSTVAVAGPGVTITLKDAPSGQIPQGATPDDLVIHQQDIEDVMNALWSGGAEAMTVQGVRITSRTVVRCIGNVILIDGTSFSPPYVISAIGDTAALTSTVNENPRIVNYKQYVTLYGLGWKMETSADLHFDAADADQTLNYAQVGNGNG